MTEINPDRLLDDLRTLRTFGATGTGVVRPSLSDIDMQSRRWLCDRFANAGLSATVDGYGTVLAKSPNQGDTLLIGSHTDTQPTGGWLDGAMGVIYGLEVARALLETKATSHLAVNVASWIDEEGTFFGCLGSKSFCHAIAPDALVDITNAAGDTLAEKLEEAKLVGRPIHSYEDCNYRGYIEAHIEQGPFLEAEHKQIGVVTDIVGSRNITVTFEGKQNHAGTTPMHLRADAFNALMHYCHEIDVTFPKHASERTVWTVGQVNIEPNAPSIVAGRAMMNLQFRDPDAGLLDQLQTIASDIAKKSNKPGLSVTFRQKGDAAIGVAMDTALAQHIADAAASRAPDAWVRMPSGAVHDAQVLAARMPAAMLFIPSIGGVSHAFDEDSHVEDIVLGCQVLADATAAALSS